MKYQIKVKSCARALIALTVSFFAGSIAFGLEKPTPEQLRQYRADGTWAQRLADARSFGNHLADTDLIERMKYNTQRQILISEGVSPESIDEILAPPPAWRGMPTKGDVKVLILLIAFADMAPIAADTQTAVESKIFGSGSGGYPYESLTNYYQRSSYNQLELEGDVLGWYTTEYPRSSVVQTTTGRENLIKEALTYYDSQGIDFSDYDNDCNGEIDYFAVIWTGTHGAWASFWWGYQTSFNDQTFTLDGESFGKYSWQWESDSYPSGSFAPKVLIHETGHALGLPDYYDYDDSVGPRGGVGDLDMMDANRGDHNCFSKYLLEWITPTVISGGADSYTLHSSGSSPDAVLIMPGATEDTLFDEFYMVQSRFREMNDTDPLYAFGGLLIWHVDARLNGGGTDYLYNNSYTEHKLLRLMEADGLEQIEQGGNAGIGDYYVSGTSLGNKTFPNSHRYDGSSTGILIDNVLNGTLQTSFNAAINLGLSKFLDFDGDEKSDIGVFRPDAGLWYVLSSKVPGSYTTTNLGTVGDLIASADFDGDSKTDIAVWRPSTGTWHVKSSIPPWPYGITQWGLSSDIPVPADFDGDGLDDIAVWRPESGTWFVLPSGNPGSYTATQWGLPSDIPVPGDYDGDGNADIAVWRPDIGTWYVLTSSIPDSYTSTQWGLPSDIPVPGNYDADAKTDIAVWRPEEGIWYILTSSVEGSYETEIWGTAGDVPVSGDYDSDGLADIAVWRPGEGIWYILLSGSEGTYTTTYWGMEGDVTVSALSGILQGISSDPD
jgi:M6 family metalloprotease-like protein